jgi:hypothetical protein
MSPLSWRRHSCLLGRDSSRPSSRAESTVPERRDESRRRRHECPRHVMAQVNFPNYPKSPADIRSSDLASDENLGRSTYPLPRAKAKSDSAVDHIRSHDSAPSVPGPDRRTVPPRIVAKLRMGLGMHLQAAKEGHTSSESRRGETRVFASCFRAEVPVGIRVGLRRKKSRRLCNGL